MTTRSDRKKNMILGSLFGDSFALGAHWIYSQDDIAKRFGRILTLLEPPLNSYHKGKSKGDFTHIGDQTFFLLKHVQGNGGFELAGVQKAWTAFMSNYSGYMDHATKDTLANIDNGKTAPVGAVSKELAGAARIAPLLVRYDDLSELLPLVEQQTAMTHNDADGLAAARFLACVGHAVLDGTCAPEALEAEFEKLADGQVRDLVKKGLDANGSDSVAALGSFGTTCRLDHALPGIVQITMNHGHNFMDAMTANAMSGGDSATRGLIIGMLLGGDLGVDPETVQEMNRYSEILELIQG